MHFFIVVRAESLHRGKRGARGLTLGLTYPSGCLPVCQGCFMWLKTIWLRVTINPNLHSGTPVICLQTRKCIKIFQFRVQGFICFLSHLLILYYAIRKQFYIFGHILIVSCVLGVRGPCRGQEDSPGSLDWHYRRILNCWASLQVPDFIYLTGKAGDPQCR